MPVIDRARSHARSRDGARKLASGPSRRNVLTGPGRRAHSCRSAGRRFRSTLACTVGAAVARYYDPTTAQFLTRDPLEDETGQPYAYADDDPIDDSDPSGLCIGDWCPGQSLQFAEGEVTGAGKLAVGAAQAVFNPVGAVQGISSACSSGSSSEGGGLDGALQCADNLDPFSGFVNAFSACSSQQAGEDFGGSLAATFATLAGGAEGAEVDATPGGIKYTQHFQDTAIKYPSRYQPTGEEIDQVVNNWDRAATRLSNGATAYYNEESNITVVLGRDGVISARRGGF